MSFVYFIGTGVDQFIFYEYLYLIKSRIAESAPESDKLEIFSTEDEYILLILSTQYKLNTQNVVMLYTIKKVVLSTEH